MTWAQTLLTVLFWYAIVGLAIQLAVFAVGGVRSYRRRRTTSFLGLDRLMNNRFAPSVSIVIPAHNEREVVVDSVRALLGMHYPTFEVVVVDDGSTDGMTERLTEVFDLEEVPWVGSDPVPVEGSVTGVYGPRSKGPLLVVRKESSGTRADAVNAGINHASGALVCFIDADSVLQDGALLSVVRHFAHDTGRMVGGGGAIRVANGCDVQDGWLRKVRVPRLTVERIQVSEYARAFTLGRAGWSQLHGLLIISGAFGVYRRDAVVASGGLDPESLAEDADILLRTMKVARAAGQDVRMVVEPEANCWTQVPASYRDLGTQRSRWSRGMAQLLGVHKDMILNPRYRTVGLLTIPYNILYEVLQPFALAAGLVLVLLGLLTGQITPWEAFAYVAWLVGFTMLILAFGLLGEEATLSPYRGVRDGLRRWLVGLSEPFWFVWIHAFWRVRGTFQQWFRREAQWGTIERRGLGESGPEGDGPDATGSPPRSPGSAAAGEDGPQEGGSDRSPV